MRLILGSQSKARRALLEQMGYAFETMNPDIDEKAIRDRDPKKLTLALANAKADVLLAKVDGEALIITSDQVVVWTNTILEKPESAEEAHTFLVGYAKHPAETVTAVVVTNTKTGKRFGGVDVARVWFHPIPEATINELLDAPETYKYAGGFSVDDEQLKPYIAKIEGAMDSILGLPMEMTERLMKEARE